MTTDRRLLGVGLGIALIVGACGGPSPSPATSDAASQPAASQPAASADSDTSSAGPDLSFAPGAAGDLEGMLPSSAGSITFTKTSVDGSQIAGAGTPLDSSKVDPLLSKYGKSIADVRIAIATGTGGSGEAGMPSMVYALQIRGVQATDFMGAILGSSDESPAPSMATTTLGGKQVYSDEPIDTTASDDPSGGLVSAYYPKGDVLFMVIAATKDADAILAALP